MKAYRNVRLLLLTLCCYYYELRNRKQRICFAY